MAKILITGASSGFGLAAAKLFLTNGWEVFATMRSPAACTVPAHDRLHVLALDVTDAASIGHAVEQAGDLDALVNNAGVGMFNVLEGVDMAKARELFETNVLGTMAMTQAVLPRMRKRGTGVIVNISSSVTLRPFQRFRSTAPARPPSMHSPKAWLSRPHNLASAHDLYCRAQLRRPHSERTPWRAWEWTFQRPIRLSYKTFSQIGPVRPRKPRLET